MAELDQIIQVSITKETQSVATASFQIPLILTEHTVFAGRTKEYTDLESLSVDFAVGTDTHTIASKVLGQDIRPPKVIVGRKDADPETYAEALTAAIADNDDFYAVLCESHVAADQEDIAAIVQASGRVYFTSTADADTPTTATTDIGYVLNALGYDRTAIVYLPTADTEFPEAAWVGDQLPNTPGSNDWNFKSVSGVTVSSLEPDQRGELRTKEVNMYTKLGGVSVFQDGNMVDGTPIDEIILTDWLTARMQEAIYFRLINSLKIPFTRAGFTIIENEMRSVLAQGVANGGLANNPTPTVTAPDPLAVSANQRANRTAYDFSFGTRLTGSVRKIIIKGTLTV